MDAVEASYQAAKNRLGAMSLDDFRTAVGAMEVHPIVIAGETAGAMIVSGCDVHACVLPWAHGKWFGRPQMRILNSVIHRHGFARTSATTEAGRKFVERLGFEQDGSGYTKDRPYGH
jgi:hypothetical protein